MSMFPDNQARRVELEYGTTDRSLFNFFNAVYAWMAVGLAVTAVSVWFVSHTPALQSLFYGGRGFGIVLLLGMYFLAVTAQNVAMRVSATAGLGLFLLYAALLGGVISWIVLVYKVETIALAFFVTGGTFAATSVFGFVTKRDLSTVGRVAVMALFGLIIASVANMWMGSSPLSWIITYGILIVSIAITAYETQMLRNVALQFEGDQKTLSRYAVVGSLILYISFINMFMSILRILGSRR